MPKRDNKVRVGFFNISDLEIVDESRSVVIASGGPIMDVVCVEGERMLCEWVDNDGEKQQCLFPIVVLRRMIPIFEDEEFCRRLGVPVGE